MKQTYYRITTESGSLYEIDLADDGTGMWRRNGEGRHRPNATDFTTITGSQVHPPMIWISVVASL